MGFKRSKNELFTQMVDYFYRSKKDPSDVGDEVLKKDLSSGLNRIISIIKQQEKDFLLPMFTDMGLVKNVSGNNKKFLESIARHLLSEGEKVTRLTLNTDIIQNDIKILIASMKKKEQLKLQFSILLEHYIKEREEIGWTSANIKKEELINYVRQSLKNI
ncbi:BfmA/BtgA family mobilization protein [Flavobacterium sp. JP2137]|uniref:BfmA/BtgA family mobilization protein n=1 Tax=Flavobacterium sp. JP2137 TaxID=3414510 RepID=UPI003D2FA5A2